MNDLFSLDPARFGHSLTALAGAAVYGVYQVSSLLVAGRHISRSDLARAGVNVLAAAFVGAVTAYVLTGPLAGAIPFVSLRNEGLVAFALGAVGWEVLPLVIRAARHRAQREADRQAGEG